MHPVLGLALGGAASARAACAFLSAASLAVATVASASGPPALEAPAARVLEEARSLVEAMKRAERGPYARIRWFCADGTVHPPSPYPCAERGGGRQHAEYSHQRWRLAELGWSVGTILAATTWEELWDPEHRHQRLRELALERYLVDVDDGWVLRKARFYRGHVQIEDEMEAGRRHLVRLLSRPAWVEDNFLLARESVRALPHHGGRDRTRTIRRLASSIAAVDPSFERIRVKIHTDPGADDAARVRDWLASGRDGGAGGRSAAAAAESLVLGIEALYGAGGRVARFAGLLRDLRGHPLVAELEQRLAGLDGLPASERVGRLASLLARVRAAVAASSDGEANLRFLDLSIEAESELVAAALAALRVPSAARAELLGLGVQLLAAAYGSGLLGERERDTAAAAPRALMERADAGAGEYLAAVRRLQRALFWAVGTVRYTFAEPLVRYAALEPRAAQFPDDLLRGSACFPAARLYAILEGDAERHTGLMHEILGRESSGLAGLNPGAAVGRLRIVRESELEGDARLGRDEIVVLPRTISNLTPVAGIITLGEGNLLSHVQLLARNLGIPNAALAPGLAEALAPHDGRMVLFAVASSGAIVLRALEAVPESVRAQVSGAADETAAAVRVDAPVPDLSVREPIPLSALHAGLSGKLVGPKAANLGELARHFPGHVAPAIALPFGVFAAHVASGPGSPKARLDAAFRRYRDGALGYAQLVAEVEAIGRQIAAMPILPETQTRLVELLAEQVGPPGTYGVFVRSDTNVEDLPGFTGAGLNQTIPNVVGFEEQLRAIASVWSSPFTARALAWRERVLRNPEDVYPSVLLMKSVDVEKSGVLVTRDLLTAGAPGAAAGSALTVATGWGVTGVVEGEDAETLVLHDDGTYSVVSDAKAPWARRLRPKGGTVWVVATAGAVLAEEERRALRELAALARERLRPELGADGMPLPWDIEFGFSAGKLWLFQVRPLVERGEEAADRVVATLRPAARAQAKSVRIGEVVPIGGDR